MAVQISSSKLLKYCWSLHLFMLKHLFIQSKHYMFTFFTVTKGTQSKERDFLIVILVKLSCDQVKQFASGRSTEYSGRSTENEYSLKNNHINYFGPYARPWVMGLQYQYIRHFRIEEGTGTECFKLQRIQNEQFRQKDHSRIDVSPV